LDGIYKNLNTPLQAPTMKQLFRYCRGVGGMTGNLSLRIFGCKDEKIMDELSASLGKALQITNILRNMKDDASSGRLYIPMEILKNAGIESKNPQTVIGNKNIVKAREELAEIAKESYKNAYTLLAAQDIETVRPLKLIADIYKGYFDLMENRGWEIISPKPSLSKFKKLIILLKSFFSKKTCI
jgi:phytoene synthase